MTDKTKKEPRKRTSKPPVKTPAKSKTPAKPLIEMRDVGVYYGSGSARVKALKSVSITLNQGEFSAICGPSGSGKSTLLNIIGFLLKHDEGRIFFEGHEVTTDDFDELADFRREKIGIVFQGFNLIPVLSAIENVMVPRAIDGEGSSSSRKEAQELLEAVGLKDHMHKKPDELSGGQKQRVAIARALINKPRLVLADEPTANLDTTSAINIIRLMQEIHGSTDTTFLFSAHDERILPFAERRIELRDGEIIADKKSKR